MSQHMKCESKDCINDAVTIFTFREVSSPLCAVHKELFENNINKIDITGLTKLFPKFNYKTIKSLYVSIQILRR